MDARRAWLEAFLAERTRPDGPSDGRRFTCPCCGLALLRSRGAGEICDLCNWEDEGLDDPDLHATSRANPPYTLAQARQAFRRYGVMYHPADDPRIGGADTPEETQLKQAVVAAFERIGPETGREELAETWRRVDHLLQCLDAELKKKVYAYELRQRRRGSGME